MSTHADRDEMQALREIAAHAEGLKLDLASATENLSLAAVRIRDQETEIQRLNREVQKLRGEKDIAWGRVMSRRPDPTQPSIADGEPE